MQTVEDYCVEWKFLFVFYLNNPFEMRLCPFHNNCVLSEKCTGRKYICCCLFLQPISISVMDSPLHSGWGAPIVRLICHFSQVFTGHEFDWFNRRETPYPQAEFVSSFFFSGHYTHFRSLSDFIAACRSIQFDTLIELCPTTIQRWTYICCFCINKINDKHTKLQTRQYLRTMSREYWKDFLSLEHQVETGSEAIFW